MRNKTSEEYTELMCEFLEDEFEYHEIDFTSHLIILKWAAVQCRYPGGYGTPPSGRASITGRRSGAAGLRGGHGRRRVQFTPYRFGQVAPIYAVQ